MKRSLPGVPFFNAKIQFFIVLDSSIFHHTSHSKQRRDGDRPVKLSTKVATDIIKCISQRVTNHLMHVPVRTQSHADTYRPTCVWCNVEWPLSCYQSLLRGPRFPATLTSWPLAQFQLSFWWIYDSYEVSCHWIVIQHILTRTRGPFYFIFGPDANKAIAWGFKRRGEREKKDREERGWKHQGNSLVCSLHTKGG